MNKYFASNTGETYFADDATTAKKDKQGTTAILEVDAISIAKRDFAKSLEPYATNTHKFVKRRYAIK